MLELAAGIALWSCPPHIKIPGVVGLAALRGIRAKLREREEDSGNNNTIGDASSARDEVVVRWDDVRMTLQPTKKEKKKLGADAKPKRILDGVSGAAKPGRLLAIMGPSGSGKTSLLNALAAQVPRSKRLTLSGTLRHDDVSVGQDTRRNRKRLNDAVAYVQQQDVFYSQLTVRETLETAAAMRMPTSRYTQPQRSDAVDDILRAMGIAHVASSKVGDVKTRGVSGGERKRLALACELVGGSPHVVCCDEPTSGLDAFQAQRVVESLKKLASDARRTVVCSIHQPRGSIVAMFDDLCLMANGRCVYQGAWTDAPEWFERLGHPIPTNANPAEFLVDLVSVDTSSDAKQKESEARVDALAAAWDKRGRDDAGADDAENDADASRSDGPEGVSVPAASANRRAGLAAQFFMLLKRSWRQVRRDGATNKIRLSTSMNSALVFGSIFWRMGLTQTSIQDRLGLLQVSAINAAMAALMKTLTAFTSEKVIVNRERASGSYGMLPYLAAKLCAELPVGAFFPLAFGAVVYPMAGLHPRADRFAKFAGLIVLESFTSSAIGLAVSSVAPSTEAAVAMGPAVMVLFIVFGGYYVNADNVPVCFRWINKCSLIKWAFQGLCVNEFAGLEFEKSGKKYGDQSDGAAVLERLGFDGTSAGDAAREQVNVASFCYLLTLYLLEKNAPRFQSMEP